MSICSFRGHFLRLTFCMTPLHDSFIRGIAHPLTTKIFIDMPIQS